MRRILCTFRFCFLARDARLLAEMLAVGAVTEVHIPDSEEEALRDPPRLRSGTVRDLTYARQHEDAVLRHCIRSKGHTVDQGTQPVAAPPDSLRTGPAAYLRGRCRAVRAAGVASGASTTGLVPQDRPPGTGFRRRSS